MVTYSCEATGVNRELQLDMWGWKGLDEPRLTIALVYYEEVEQGLADLIQCENMVIVRETMEKSRGSSLPGKCSRYLESSEKAALRIDEAVKVWTGYSGLAKSIPRSNMDVIFELLKR